MVAVSGGVGGGRAEAKVFIAHRATGVRVIPAGWLDAWRPSGFREATPSEVLGWYEERGLEPPSEVLRSVAAIAAESAAGAALGDRATRAITLPG